MQFCCRQNKLGKVHTYVVTLVSLIIVQDEINVQNGKIPKVDKRAGWNKAVQDGLFHFSLV